MLKTNNQFFWRIFSALIRIYVCTQIERTQLMIKHITSAVPVNREKDPVIARKTNKRKAKHVSHVPSRKMLTRVLVPIIFVLPHLNVTMNT